MPSGGPTATPQLDEPVCAPVVGRCSRWHVILHDDDDHSYDYVIEMLMRLFDHGLETALRMAIEVDATGRVIVDTTSRERAELKQEQVHAYGPDWRIPRCAGAMSCVLEPADT